MCISEHKRRRSLLSEPALFLQVEDDSRTPMTSNCSSNTIKTSFSSSSSVLESDKFDESHKQNNCGVQHNYHDHAFDVDEENSDASNITKGGVSIPFPLKLYRMLEHIDHVEPELSQLISWQPHGRCFLVHRQKQFAEKVLPRFFQQKKYASFQRQLNLYGFSRITRKDADRGSYYHELFLKNKEFLCKRINRMKIKGTGARMASNPDAEPDFYSMRPINSIQLQTSIPFAIVGIEPPSSGILNKSVESKPFHCEKVVSSRFETSQNTGMYSHDGRDDIELVFDDMPFHLLSNDVGTNLPRRHSLAEVIIHCRTSIGNRDFNLDLEKMFSLFGNSVLSDKDLAHNLDKLTDL